MKKITRFLLVVFAINSFIITACSGTTEAPLLLTGTWKLISYGSPANTTSALPDTEASLTFDEQGQVTGNMGCNTFGGSYTVDGDTITFGPITSTLMACADAIMEQESAIFSALVGTATFKIEGNTLTITSADAGSVLTFEHKS